MDVATTLVLIFIIAFGLIGMKSDKKKAAYQDPTLFLHGINGKLEYLSSWYAFWDDIVPEVYKACKLRFNKVVSVYNQEFIDVGIELYGHEPAVEALNRAMTYMTTIGRTHNVSYTEDERWFHHYRRPDLTYEPFIITKKVYDQQYPDINEPSEDDPRRRCCICSDGATVIPLQKSYRSK